MNQIPAHMQFDVDPQLPAPIPLADSIPGAGFSVTPVQVNPTPGQTVLTVGPTGEFQTIAAAVAAAQNGDLILVAPGTYVNDFADITAQVTIAGAGGIVNCIATEPPPNEKGLFIVDNSCTIVNMTFQDVSISDADGGNGAGIRYQGGNMTLINDAFIDNQDGILAAGVDNLPQNTVTIDQCSFDNNGNSTGEWAGYTHNLYVSTGVTSLVAENDVFERANVGHELKSRAESNYITGCVFYDGPSGTASYSIDLPDGGADTVIGNVLEKGPNSGNQAFIHFGGEGLPYANSSLEVDQNQFINDYGPAAWGVLNQTMTTVTVDNNQFDSISGSQIAQGAYEQSGNTDQNGDTIPPSQSGTFAPGTDLYNYSQDDLPHTLTLTTASGVLGGGGLLTVYADCGHDTVEGGSGGLDYIEQQGYGGSYIVTAAGASDTVIAPGQDAIELAGNDILQGGSGNLTVEVTGSASVAGAAGSNGYSVTGTLNLVGAGGSDTVELGQGADAWVTGVESFLQATVDGGAIGVNIAQAGAAAQITITGGSAALGIYNSATSVTTAGGGGGALITLGAGTATVFSEGQDTIRAGVGVDTVLASGSSVIDAGSGQLAVYGHSENGTATVFGAAGTVTIGGDTGDIVYVGGANANTVQAGLSNITITGGTGLMTATAGSRQVITGGSGGMALQTQGGADTITTAAGAHDTIGFTGACVVTCNGNDLVNAGAGNSTITANGADSIIGSTGNAQYVLNGNDTLAANSYSQVTTGGGGHDSITAYGSLTALTSQGGTVTFLQADNADHESVTLVGGSITLLSNAAQDVTQVTLGGATDGMLSGAGHLSILMQANREKIWAGSGSDSVTVGGGGERLQGGAGALNVNMSDYSAPGVTSVYGGGGTLTIGSGGYGTLNFYGGRGAANIGMLHGAETVAAASGNLTLGGGTAGTVFTAGSGSASVTLQASGGLITFGSGAASITESQYGQAVIYDFNAGHGGGTDSITGFRSGTDELNFNGVSVTGSTVQNGSTLLTLSDGTRVDLVGFSGGGFMETNGGIGHH
jgi:hypothetical protein